MEFTEPMPFESAVARFESKTPIASALRSDDWAQIALGLRDRAFFSAGVDSLRTLSTMQSKIGDALNLTRDSNTAFTDRGKFIADMRTALGAAPGDTHDLTDITSTSRLGLIYDFQLEDAREFGRWQAGQDPAILDEFPAQGLIRVEDRKEPRDWAARWSDAGGTFYDNGRMIARKDDPIWVKISRFGRPWPPFDYGSGMGLQDIDRDEAESLGVISADDTVAPQEADFNQGLEASAPDATPAVLDGFKEIFGDQVDVGDDGKITWQGQRVQSLYDDATADDSVSRSLDLGIATSETIAAADDAGVDLTDARLQLTADDVRNADASSLDVQLVPHVWRAPDSIQPGASGSLEFKSTLAGRNATVTFEKIGDTNAWRVKAISVAKHGGGK